jgi:pimeloyl-ACP methyl ester carboxylesterase
MPLIDALAPGSYSISINGLEQRYHVAGKGPLCIVHPGGPGVDWAYIRMPEVEVHLTLIYLEPIGTGASGRLPQHPRGYNIQRYSQQLGGFVNALNLANFFLLGHSHGGLVIQQYAIAHPDKIAGIIIYDSSAVVSPEFIKEAGQNIAAFAKRDAGSPEADEVIRGWASIPHIGSAEEYTLALRLLLPVCFANHRGAGLVYSELRSKLRANFVLSDDKPFDAREALQRLLMPALILVGVHDFICGPKWADILHAALRGSQLVAFNLSGHMAHVEQPDAFAGVIGAFVFRNRESGKRRQSSSGTPKIVRLFH